MGLLAIVFIAFILIFLPSVTWSGIERCLNINYVDHISVDGSRIILNNTQNAADPTYEELIDFLKNDQTNQIRYNSDSFVYAQKLHDSAEKAGYRCAWVSVQFTEGREHACNSFNTTDKGTVFVDRTSGNSGGNWDSFVDVDIGKQYIPRDTLHGSVRYDPIGIVKDYEIYW